MRAAESQRFLLFSFEHGSPTRVALFSGGLDSFAGAAQTLCDFADYNYIFVSGVTNTRQQGAQRGQLNRLRLKTSARICHVAIPYGLHWAGLRAERKEKSSQRTRGFLFLTLGAVSAIAARTKFIELKNVELDLCRNRKVQPAELQSKLLHLYSQYAAEWGAFSACRHCDVCKRIA